MTPAYLSSPPCTQRRTSVNNRGCAHPLSALPQVASGLRAHYSLEEMQGRRLLVICNMKKRKMQGFNSFGMVLCAKTDGKVEFVSPPDGAKPGDRVVLECRDERVLAQLLRLSPLAPSNKLSFEKLQAFLSLILQ